ncbi:putative sortase SrtB family [Clostridium sp. CAG:451]|nr:putative sortase SrtB family [Clostridium sp. CAG:451]
MKNKKEKMYIYLIILIFVLSFILYFISIQPKSSKLKLEDKTTEINKAKKYGDSVVGWLTVEGTNIDLPLIQVTDNTNINRRDYNYAWIYAHPDLKSNHVSYISHNIRNVSRKPIINDKNMSGFEQLLSFIYPSFISDNQYIAYTVNNEQALYKIYAVSLVENDQSASFKDIYTESEQQEYIEKAKKTSMYNIDVDVNKDDKLLSLITCTRFYGGNAYSFVVDARKVRDNEKNNISKVEINKNYKPIEERMKEGVKNEEV